MGSGGSSSARNPGKVTTLSRRDSSPTILSVGLQRETIRVSGIRCERCVGRLAAALRGHEGLEYANANLVGDLTLAWDERQTSRTEILAVLARSGFREAPADRE
jgi:hypothetical protein